MHLGRRRDGQALRGVEDGRGQGLVVEDGVARFLVGEEFDEGDGVGLGFR